jgi:hypothetical protein
MSPLRPQTSPLAAVLFLLVLTPGIRAQAVMEKPAEASQPELNATAPRIANVMEANDAYLPLTARERWLFYWQQSYASSAVAFRSLVSPLALQWGDRPPEWGQGVAGYSRRASSTFGRYTLSDSFQDIGAAALGHEVRYVRCRCSNKLARFGYAFTSPLFTRNRTGEVVPNFEEVGGVIAADAIAMRWMPRSQRSLSRLWQQASFDVGAQGWPGFRWRHPHKVLLLLRVVSPPRLACKALIQNNLYKQSQGPAQDDCVSRSWTASTWCPVTDGRPKLVSGWALLPAIEGSERKS